MFVGPIFAREILTTPRRPRHYILRATYVGLFFVLMWTAWQSIVGFQTVQRLGDLAHFNAILFELFALVQLSLVLFVSSLYGASAVSHEKDRRTFVLLLITRLYDAEIVVSKFLCGLLQVGAVMLAALPAFVLTALMGGVSFSQVAQVYGVTLGVALAAGAGGVLVAVWREKTFQSVSMTILAIVLALAPAEVAANLAGDYVFAGRSLVEWRNCISPFRALADVIVGPQTTATSPALLPSGWMNLAILTTLAIVLLTIATVKLRDWNPRGEPLPQAEEGDENAGVNPRTGKRLSKTRPVWSNPVLWREIRTRAYGTKPVMVKGAYLVILATVLGLMLANLRPGDDLVSRYAVGRPLALLSVLSLLLLNVQAVTAITSERDLRSIDLLLATDITPKEFIYGKLFGILYNSKEAILVPIVFLLVCAALGWVGWVGLFYTLSTFVVFVLFSAILGIHSGMRHDSTRLAIAHSLGTVFLLFIGILVCLFLIIVSGRFEAQWGSFILFIVLGSVGLWVSISANAPSGALALTAFMMPFATFYCVVAFLVGEAALPFLVGCGAYGFGVLAMMVPLLAEFDVATGRTTIGEG